MRRGSTASEEAEGWMPSTVESSATAGRDTGQCVAVATEGRVFIWRFYFSLKLVGR